VSACSGDVYAGDRARDEEAVAILYDRLGGAYPIAVVVDTFIERLLVNQTLNANPAIDKARQQIPKQGLKFHVTTLVCEATGGPCKYVGRSMKASHAHLNITESEWQAMLVDFRATLDAFKYPPASRRNSSRSSKAPSRRSWWRGSESGSGLAPNVSRSHSRCAVQRRVRPSIRGQVDD
jgi:hemoglobin